MHDYTREMPSLERHEIRLSRISHDSRLTVLLHKKRHGSRTGYTFRQGRLGEPSLPVTDKPSFLNHAQKDYTLPTVLTARHQFSFRNQ